MTRHKRTNEGLVVALTEQYDALLASSANYDSGKLWEAKRLATAIYTIFHDGGRNAKSILTQLGIRGTVSLLSCVKPPDKPGTQTNAIANGMCRVSHTAEGPIYAPVLARAFFRRHVRFSEWWEETIFENTQGQTITRKNLVSSLRDQDGGSHFDPSIPDSAYLRLKDASETPLLFFPGDGDKEVLRLADAVPIRNGHLAIMRQVAYEATESIRVVL